jgi:ABC-type uncharacterized transport system permease subunit
MAYASIIFTNYSLIRYMAISHGCHSREGGNLVLFFLDSRLRGNDNKIMFYAFITVLSLYLFATLFYLLRLIFGKPVFSALALRVTMVGALAQLGVLVFHFIQMPKPWMLTYLEYLQLSALVLAVLFIVLCFTKRFYGSGPFFIAFIDLFCIYSLTLENPFLENLPRAGSGYLSIHLICIFLSLSVFSIGLVVALMFLLSERQLKHKQFDGIVSRFPSLAVLDSIHYKSLYVGFVLFTFAIITGAGYSKMMTGHYLANDSKQFVSIACWIFFAVLLNFRVRQGWQGHKGVLLSLVGFVGMVFLFILGLQ